MDNHSYEQYSVFLIHLLNNKYFHKQSLRNLKLPSFGIIHTIWRAIFSIKIQTTNCTRKFFKAYG